jgi:hypothetical protein
MAKGGDRFRLKSPPGPSENDVERGCIALMQLRGYWVIRVQSGLFKTPDNRWIRIGEKGIPDYAAVHERWPGFLLEIKRTGGGLSPEQIQKIQELEMGYRLSVGVVDSTTAMSSFLDTHERKATELWRGRDI